MKPIRILIDFERLIGFNRDALTGIAQEMQGYDNIFLDLKRPGSPVIHAVSSGEQVGIITAAYSEPEVEKVLASGVPCVNIANLLEAHSRLPVVGNDDKAIGIMVAEFYLNRGFRHFGYSCGAGNEYFDARREAFKSRVEEAGYSCSISPSRDVTGETKIGADQRTADWLAQQPKPFAVMCPFDTEAREAIQSALLAGLRVPEEVAVVGVDNDLNLCLTIWPQISSVATAAIKIGQTALKVLMGMIQGEPPPARPMLLPPNEIVERGSTGDVAIADPDIAAAIHFMRNHLNERLTVSRIADEVAVSRRTLERKFDELVGHTPLQELRRLRVERAKRLLISTDFEFKDIAKRSGFIHVQRLSNVLKEYTGSTPGKFRSQFGRPR
jgi:LacI family transcriptional regulator